MLRVSAEGTGRAGEQEECHSRGVDWAHQQCVQLIHPLRTCSANRALELPSRRMKRDASSQASWPLRLSNGYRTSNFPKHELKNRNDYEEGPAQKVRTKDWRHVPHRITPVQSSSLQQWLESEHENELGRNTSGLKSGIPWCNCSQDLICDKRYFHSPLKYMEMTTPQLKLHVRLIIPFGKQNLNLQCC